MFDQSDLLLSKIRRQELTQLAREIRISTELTTPESSGRERFGGWKRRTAQVLVLALQPFRSLIGR